MRLTVLAGAVWFCSLAAAHADDDICPNGAIYNLFWSTQTIVVKRVGIGESSFAPGAPPIAGIALDLVAGNGDKATVFGPTRYSMVMTTLQFLNEQGYKWEPPSKDPGGIYTVLDHDGSELFTLQYVGCAP